MSPHFPLGSFAVLEGQLHTFSNTLSLPAGAGNEAVAEHMDVGLVTMAATLRLKAHLTAVWIIMVATLTLMTA